MLSHLRIYFSEKEPGNLTFATLGAFSLEEIPEKTSLTMKILQNCVMTLLLVEISMSKARTHGNSSRVFLERKTWGNSWPLKNKLKYFTVIVPIF